jgi:hypothetical protein
VPKFLLSQEQTAIAISAISENRAVALVIPNIRSIAKKAIHDSAFHSAFRLLVEARPDRYRSGEMTDMAAGQCVGMQIAMST